MQGVKFFKGDLVDVENEINEFIEEQEIVIESISFKTPVTESIQVVACVVHVPYEEPIGN